MFQVTDLQACEPGELFRDKPEDVTVTVQPGHDSMGFNRVTVEAPTKARLIAFVVDNWGDDDLEWIDEWVVDRIETVPRAAAPYVGSTFLMRVLPDGPTSEPKVTEKGDLICPACGNDDLGVWADDGEADLGDWFKCDDCGVDGALVRVDDVDTTQNGKEVN